MNQLIKESEEEDENTSKEEDFQDADANLDESTDIEMDPPPSPKHTSKTTTTTPSTIIKPIQPHSTQTIPETPTQPISQPQKQQQSPTHQPKEKEPENVPSNTVIPPAATTVEHAAKDHVFSPSKKLRSKSKVKRRKLAEVQEDAALDVEGVTTEEDNQIKATVDAVMKGMEDVAVSNAAAIADVEKVKDERKSKEALYVVLAQKKANVSNAGLVVADTGSVLQ